MHMLWHGQCIWHAPHLQAALLQGVLHSVHQLLHVIRCSIISILLHDKCGKMRTAHVQLPGIAVR